jgi:hypothetical protein
MGGYMNATVDKAEIENAIEEINGVIMDFTDAVNSLTGVKNLLWGNLWPVDREGKPYLVNVPDVRRFIYPGIFFILKKRV